MARCLWCGNEIGGGHFCKSSGHHILYKNALLKELASGQISQEHMDWLVYFKWLPGEDQVKNATKKVRTRKAKVVGTDVAFRKFGVELECCCPFDTESQIISEVRDQGVEMEHTGYTHEVRDQWKSLYDSSVRASGMQSKEFVSPPIDKEEEFKQVETVCKVVSDHGGIVNQTTGTHVHLDASDLTTQEIAKIVYLYGKLETKINAFLPADRRRNRYCKSVKKFVKYADRWGFDTFDSEYRIQRVMRTRYTKVNVFAYSKYKTIEFRQLNGTLDPELIKFWLKLCTRIVDYVKSGKDVTQTNGKISKVLGFQQDEIDFWNSVRTSIAVA